MHALIINWEKITNKSSGRCACFYERVIQFNRYGTQKPVSYVIRLSQFSTFGSPLS